MADYSDLIAKYSKKYGVPEKLIHQLINVESSGKADAVSPTGPVGLMQVSRAVAQEAGYKKSDMYDPEKNIDAGVRYLAKNLEAFKGNVPHALLGYNQGTGGAQQMLSGKKPMAQEGWNYIHNKKFSPEYLVKGAAIPAPSEAKATEDLVKMGQEGMQPQQPKYSPASMMQVTPEQPAPTPPPEPTEVDKLNDMANKARQAFNPLSVYQTRPTNTVQRGLLDQWSTLMPSVQNSKSLFGGFN